MKPRKFWWIRITVFQIQWYVRDVVASVLQDTARWIAP